MSRLQRILVGTVVVVVAAVLAGCGSGDDSEPAQVDAPAPVGDAPDVAVNVPEADAPQPDNGEGASLFDVWAEPLRAAGYVVETGAVTDQGGGILFISDLVVAAPSDALGWRWAASSAIATDVSASQVTLAPSGTQTLSLSVEASELCCWADGVTMELGTTIVAETLEIDVEQGADGIASTVSATFGGLELQDDDGAAVALITNGVFRSGPAADSPDPVASVRLTGVDLPGQADGPLGATINALSIEFSLTSDIVGLVAEDALDPAWAGAKTLAIRSLELGWGQLFLTGSGVLAFDEAGRPSAVIEAEIYDVLTTLDAFHAVRRFDRDLLADVYAAILDEMGENPEAESLPFNMVIANGEIILAGDSRGISDIPLGVLGALFTPIAVP